MNNPLLEMAEELEAAVLYASDRLECDGQRAVNDTACRYMSGQARILRTAYDVIEAAKEWRDAPRKDDYHESQRLMKRLKTHEAACEEVPK